MKAAFIRQATTSTFWAWKSLQYLGAEALLDAFVFKSKTLSLAIELEADIWIVEGCDHVFAGTSSPEYTKEIMRRHQTVPLSAIPWHKYDVVISILPIVPDRIIERFQQQCCRVHLQCHTWWANNNEGQYKHRRFTL